MTTSIVSEESVRLSRADAEALTDAIRSRGAERWRLLLQAYEGGAHEAMGYKSWSDYLRDALGIKKAESHRLLYAGHVERRLRSLNLETDGLNGAQAQVLYHRLVKDGHDHDHRLVEVAEWAQEHGGWGTRGVTASGIANHLLFSDRARRMPAVLEGGRAQLLWLYELPPDFPLATDLIRRAVAADVVVAPESRQAIRHALERVRAVLDSMEAGLGDPEMADGMEHREQAAGSGDPAEGGGG